MKQLSDGLRQMGLRGCALGTTVILSATVGCGGSSSPTAPSAETAKIYELTDGVTLPEVIRNVRPAYTAQALAAKVQGSVLLGAVVLSDGTVGEVTVIRSLDTQYGLDLQAIIAAKQWLFTPATKDGVPVAVRVTIEMTFTIIG